MYETFFRFREKPFNLTPDPRFLYLSPKHNEAFAHLDFGLKQRGGFMVVTGEVGTGKTTLCRYFLDRLDKDTLSAFVLYPSLSVTDLLNAVIKDLDIETEATTPKGLIDDLHRFLLQARRGGKNVVMVIDEAQNLSRDVLEQVRLVSNLETSTEKLIQIVLIAQSELNDMLAQKDLRQLAQRVTARYHLTPLSQEEMTNYVRHRLAVAGGIGKVDFTPAALRRIHRFSGGVPRLINLVCDRALLAGYVLNRREIDGNIARQAVEELNLQKPKPVRRRLRWGLAGAAAMLLIVVGLAALPGIVDARSDHPILAFLDGLRRKAVWPRATGVDPLSVEKAAQDFEARLVTLSKDLSRRAASAELLSRWDIHLGGGVSALSVLEDMPALAERAGLQYSRIDTTLDQLRAVNVPVVLELFHPSRKDTLFATLTELDGGWAIVHFAPGDSFRVPITALTNYWTGGARTFWRDYESLHAADESTRLEWARERLEEIGLLENDSTDKQFDQALGELQKRILVEPNGELGEETRLALYSLSGGYRVPHLSQP